MRNPCGMSIPYGHRAYAATRSGTVHAAPDDAILRPINPSMARVPGTAVAEKTAEDRSRYRYGLAIPTRWMDCDPYGHVNNAQYYSFFDTVVGHMLIEKRVLRGPFWKAIGLVIASECAYIAPINFPDVIDAGLRIGRMGSTSLHYEISLFKQGESTPAASGSFVHVFVDPDTRRPVPIVEPVRQLMSALTL